MGINPLGMFSKNSIGIDIGTSSIKVVELSSKQGKTLVNYASLNSEYFAKQAFYTREKGHFSVDENHIAQALASIFKEAGIKTKNAYFSIPDYVSFFTSFDLPPMTNQEIGEAVKYEAPRRIPLPLSEVTLDWQVIKGGPGTKGNAPLRVLLVTVPNEAINQYQRIAESLKIKAVALEAEAFALVRALVRYQDKGTVVCLIDIGERSTTINIVSQGVLKTSYSVDVSAESFTKALSDSLGVDKAKATVIKQAYGITDKSLGIKEILQPVADLILQDTKRIFNELYLEDKERVAKVILTGGGSALPGLVEYFFKSLDIPIELANPFLNIVSPLSIQDRLKKIGPEFTIATGMALRGLNQ